jgi:nicotinamidase/pyrazinamidase
MSCACFPIAEMLDLYGEEHIHDIYVTMDTRHPCHISHAVSWHRKGDRGEHPIPFTRISHSDVMLGVWVYGDGSEAMQHWANTYTALLQAQGKVLYIWPEHCIIGTPGHSVVPSINAALQRWTDKVGRPVNYVMKGHNMRVEMYSALQAEVPDPLDLSTSLNVNLLAKLKTSDRVSINCSCRSLLCSWM